MARTAGSTPRTFHVHFESNSSKPRQFQVLESDVKAAVRRHPELARRLKITVGFDRKMLPEALRTADFMLNADPPRENLRAMAPRLEWIQTTGAGIDGLLPLDWLPEGCVLTNNSGAHAAKAQDSGAMGLLMLNAFIPQVMTAQREKHWAHAFSTPIAGKTAVVVGFGDVGAAVGRGARKLGVHVIAVTRTGALARGMASAADEVVPVSKLARVIGKADFVVVATPLTAATRGLVDAAMLDRMKQGAGLMNIGRAPVVDYDALCERLASGRLSGAILDVFSPEPLPPASPLWTVPNLVVLPHITCDDPRYIAFLLDFWFENFGRRLAGRKLKNIVEPARGY
ncbi:MAG: D-2-hydroxyacid dehydrogenase [Betaproteobacteria bacterium]|jgi:phosphoglycerate dehydrogenase-like enzyme|nr:D-2-hydroxyacid dehydrogenase [Betaproteobacteria bacterium]